jgi:hypothetical protein
MRSSLVLVLALSLGSASCWFRARHPARTFVPPPVRARRVVLPPPPQLPEPPEIEAKSGAEIPPEMAFEIPVLPPPPAPPKRPPVVATPKPIPPPVAVEPPPSPRIGQIFTAEQLREYNRSLDESLGRVRTILAVAAGKPLTADQGGMVTRIRTFVMQAEEARDQDLVTAVSLAKRADLLAQDLAARLR